MPRGQQRAQFLNFVGGLNTESSPLVFPENTAKDLDNVDLRRDGSIKRRRGMEYESQGVYNLTAIAESDLSTWAVTEHEWESVDEEDTVNFVVLQIGGSLYFHNLGNDTLSRGIIGILSLDPIKTRDDYANFPIDGTYGAGKFFIVSRGISPAYIQYDSDTGTFSGVKITVKIRDIDGLPEDDTAPTVFGSSVTPAPEDQTDPEDDTDDTSVPVINPGDFIDFENIDFGSAFQFL